ncbi:TPA: hypothetical protein DIT23_00880 [candidate division WOR-3 bacterium]|nr:hypothetical protein [candidate division WOR-3 bacterium]
MLVVTVFAAVTANTLVEEHQIIIPTFGVIIVAFIFGILVYRLKLNYILATAGALILIFFLFILGNRFSISFGGSNAIQLWILILLLYSFNASIIPVNLLLQPRIIFQPLYFLWT